MEKPANRVRLTTGRLDTFVCSEDRPQAFLWDTETPSLALRATPTGRKTYVFESRLRGATIRMTIGTLADWPIAQARQKAAEFKRLVDSGIDPREVEREKQTAALEKIDAAAAKATAAKVASLTVGEAWADYLTKRRPFWGDLHYRDHVDKAKSGGLPSGRRGGGKQLTKPGPLASLMPLALKDLDQPTIESWAAHEGLAQALSSQGDVFFSGETELVQALPSRFKTLDRSDLQYLLGHRVALVARKDGQDIPMNIPAELVSMTYSAMGQKPNQTPPRLISVTRLPYATADKRIVTQPGFDAVSGIYNLMEQNECLPVGPTTRAALIEALRTIWKPWANYKFASNTDRGAMLAAIFTAVQRPAMSLAPGVFFDAPVQGSGKTKAALALGALMTGAYVGVYPYVEGRNQEEETSKALVATLRSERRFWLIDNVTGRFDSAVLAGMITSGRVQGRILGMSKDGDFSARVMLCATGNNATLGSDLNRRFLLCRIDTGVERPTDVPHSFEPAQVAKDSRMQIASAVLTVVKAYWEAHQVTVAGGADFHEWSKLVREPLIWLQEQGLAEAAGIGQIEDPAKALGHGTAASNPEQIGLQQLLDGLEVQAGINKPFYARDVHIWYLEGEHRAGQAEGLIRDGVDNLTGGKIQTPRSLAHVLLNRRDRRVCGKRLANVGTDRDGVIWHVRTD